MNLTDLKNQNEAPEFLTEEGFKTLSNGYLLENETPRQMYQRIAKSAASYYEDSTKWEEKFFDTMWKNWLCPASPVLSNLGTNRAFPISCFSISVGDSIDDIFNKNHELAMLTKSGGGVGIYIGSLRGRNATIKGNGKADGVIGWCKVFDTTTQVVSQGSTRRGASAVYLPIDHPDIEEFLNIRRPIGDVNRRCLNINHGVCITDQWMQEMLAGDQEKRLIYQEVLKNRVETGEPYLFFTDNVNNANPECYKQNNLRVETSNICCVSGKTLVLTRNGPRRIDELIGQAVEIWDGENWVENNSFVQRGTDKLYRVSIADGSYVDANLNHRWFVAHNYTDIRNNKYHEILTKDLKVGQWIEYHNEEVHGNKNIKGAYLKGFLVGDGTHIKDRPLLRLHSEKYMCIQNLITSGNEILPEGELNTNCIDDISFSKEYDYTEDGLAYGVQKLKNMKGLTARKKELIFWAIDCKINLPDDVFSWDKQSKLSFLAGLFDADGTVGNSSIIQIASIHKIFIEKLQLLLKTFGISSNMDVIVRKNIEENDCYRLTLSGFDSFNILKILPVARLQYKGKAPNRKSSGWRRIVSIKELEGVHPVYCPTLPSTGKFGLANGLMTGNTEIFLYTEENCSFLCCLSSLNLTRWEEWKDTDLVETAVRFLDAIIQEYIVKSENVPGLENSRRSAIKGRAIGIGVLGFHSLLQSKMLPFDSFETMQLNNLIFKTIKEKAEKETQILAQELGEPEWCKGFNRRNTHCIALAPTVSNSLISGGVSPSIEPWAANIFVQRTAKGTFIRKNIILEKLLEDKKQNTTETWRSINEQQGSVQHLTFLTPEEKAVYLTAREINQHIVIKLASQRQKYIDQGQSVNLFFASNAEPKYIHEVHIAAWEGGLKSLYYFRSEGVIRGDQAFRSKDECSACEG